MTHSQCEAKRTITFPAAGHRCPVTGIKLYCLVREEHASEQLVSASGTAGDELATSRVFAS